MSGLLCQPHPFHFLTDALADVHTLCQEVQMSEWFCLTPITPQKERSFLPRLLISA